jgi:hypothetical protein
MHSIRALSLAPVVCEWLAASRLPHILHVFDQACNLINERREVLSIVTQEIGNGPFNLVVEDQMLFLEQLDAESPISIPDHQLILGDLIINTKQARIWSPRPDWERLHQNRENILSKLESSSHQPAIPKLLLHDLSSALANADLPSATVSAKQLAGLGAGLTPAGDDFLMGAMYAAWIVHPHEVAATLTRQMAIVASPLTTSLSAAWLMSAGRGEAGILWHAFFDSLISTDESRIQSSINKILDMGETSGADALAGFVNTMTQ